MHYWVEYLDGRKLWRNKQVHLRWFNLWQLLLDRRLVRKYFCVLWNGLSDYVWNGMYVGQKSRDGEKVICSFCSLGVIHEVSKSVVDIYVL
jgi:hypothetical protein